MVSIPLDRPHKTAHKTGVLNFYLYYHKICAKMITGGTTRPMKHGRTGGPKVRTGKPPREEERR
jgi:hypothetical protein